jgi:hypothetical protein
LKILMEELVHAGRLLAKSSLTGIRFGWLTRQG